MHRHGAPASGAGARTCERCVRRLIQLVLVLLLVTFFTSLLIDAACQGMSRTPWHPSPRRSSGIVAARAAISTEPVVERYGEWVSGLRARRPRLLLRHVGLHDRERVSDKVADRVKDALPISLHLMFYAQMLALVIAIPMGVLTAYRAGTSFDKTVEHDRVRAARHTRTSCSRSCSRTTSV